MAILTGRGRRNVLYQATASLPSATHHQTIGVVLVLLGEHKAQYDRFRTLCISFPSRPRVSGPSGQAADPSTIGLDFKVCCGGIGT